MKNTPRPGRAQPGHPKQLSVLLTLLLALTGCGPSEPLAAPARADAVQHAAETPAAIVERLNRGELAGGFAALASGQLVASGTTPDYGASLHAHSLVRSQVYRLTGSGKFSAWMFKKINGVWSFSRNVDGSLNVTFRGGETDFSELYIYGFSDGWNRSAFRVALDKVASPKPTEKTIYAPYLYQYGISGLSSAQRNAACAPAAAAELADARGRRKKGSLNDEAVYLYGQFGTTTSAGSNRYTVTSKLRELYGFNAEHLTSDLWSAIVAEIDAGRPVIFRSWSIPGYPGGHYLLVKGYKSNPARLVTSDPGTSAGNGKEYDWAAASRVDASVIRAR